MKNKIKNLLTMAIGYISIGILVMTGMVIVKKITDSNDDKNSYNEPVSNSFKNQCEIIPDIMSEIYKCRAYSNILTDYCLCVYDEKKEKWKPYRILSYKVECRILKGMCWPRPQLFRIINEIRFIDK